MKIITTYVAFDDEEFSTMEACQAYENFHMGLMIEAEDCFSFFDAGMHQISLNYSHNVEEMLDAFVRAYDECYYIIVKKKPSDNLERFIKDYEGLMPPVQEGFWRYNYATSKWKKVSEDA